MYKKVSIIIPSLNQSLYIKKAIDSIIQQDYAHKEIWVIDGRSTDNTLQILKSFGGKIKWISEKDNGQSAAINKGLHLCDGDICCFLNSDDFLLPGALSRVVSTFERTKKLWLTGDYLIINSKEKTIQRAITFYEHILRSFSSYGIFSIVDYIAQPSTFWRRELMERIGYFDETYRYTFDYDYWRRAFQIERPYVLKEALSAFRIHEKSKSGSEYRNQFAEELIVLDKYCNNGFLKTFHRIHNKIIVFGYGFLKANL